MSSQEILSKFIHVEGGRNLPGGKFTRNEMLTVHDLAEYRRKHSNTGIYMSAYMYDTPDVKEANLYADFYLDFDSDEDFEKARKDCLKAIWYLKQPFKYAIPEQFIRIYFSGKKGLHITIPAEVLGIEPDKHLNEYYKLMAKEISEHLDHGTLDIKIYDRRRLFRVRNSRHHDTNLFKIPLTYKELSEWSADTIRKTAEQPRIPVLEATYEIARAKAEFQKHITDWENRFGKKFSDKKKFGVKPLDFVPACVQEIIESGPVKGQRNNTAAALVSFYKRQAMSQQEIWDKIVVWNRGSLSERELKMVLESVFDGDYEYGCSTLETLATCIGEKCPLYRKDK